MELVLERTKDNNIVPEVRKQLVMKLATELPKRAKGFRFSVLGLAEELDVDWATAQSLLKDAVQIWKRDHEDEIELQKEWIRRRIDEADRLPPNCSRVQQIRFMLELFEKLNVLEKVSPTMLGSDMGDGSFVIYGKMGANTLRALAEKKGLKIIEQDGTGNSIQAE